MVEWRLILVVTWCFIQRLEEMVLSVDCAMIKQIVLTQIKNSNPRNILILIILPSAKGWTYTLLWLVRVPGWWPAIGWDADATWWFIPTWTNSAVFSQLSECPEAVTPLTCCLALFLPRPPQDFVGQDPKDSTKAAPTVDLPRTSPRLHQLLIFQGLRRGYTNCWSSKTL